MKEFLKKVLLIILFAGLFYFFERYRFILASEKHFHLCYSHPLLNFASVIFGPVIGGLAITLGMFFLHINEGPVRWLLMGCALLNCASIGFLMRKIDIKNGFFYRKDVIYFNFVQASSNYLIWWLIFPALHTLILHEPFRKYFEEGFIYALCLSISSSIVATMFLTLYSRARFSEANFYQN
ncbi:MAG: ECF transporter S component [Anaerolineaceae bacterium]|nr:ECF transporter S component [Anaerolineaceae bacterium]